MLGVPTGKLGSIPLQLGFPVDSWMNPKLSLAAEAQLRSQQLCITREGHRNVEKLQEVTNALLAQSMMQAAVIRQATLYIAQLEEERGVGFGAVAVSDTASQG